MLKIYAIIICLFLNTSIYSATLHTILVSDTTEGEVSYGTECSIDMIHRQMRRVAFYTGSDLSVSFFEGWHVTIDNVKSYLENLQVEKDDIVVLFFAMHGSRQKDKSEKWPDLSFTLQNSHYDFNTFAQIVQNKSPKFLLAIADSCNSVRDLYDDVDDEDEEEDEEENKRNLENYITSLNINGPSSTYFTPYDSLDKAFAMEEDETLAYYQSLFLRNGSVKISSSQPGESAVRDYSGFGGYFTLCFLKAMREQVSDWEAMLNQTMSDVRQMIETKEPLYKPYTIQFEIN